MKAVAQKLAVSVQPEVLVAGSLRLDATRRRAWRRGEVLDLTPAELGILECLMRHAGVARTREQIAEALLAQTCLDYTDAGKAVVTHISRLRRKMDEKWPVKLLRTVRGAGYMLVSN